MKVRASLWYSFPGSIPEMRNYRSIGDVTEDFESMLYDYRRFGGMPPVGFIYMMESDDPIWMLETSKRETLRMTRC